MTQWYEWLTNKQGRLLWCIPSFDTMQQNFELFPSLISQPAGSFVGPVLKKMVMARLELSTTVPTYMRFNSLSKISAAVVFHSVLSLITWKSTNSAPLKLEDELVYIVKRFVLPSCEMVMWSPGRTVGFSLAPHGQPELWCQWENDLCNNCFVIIVNKV